MSNIPFTVALCVYIKDNPSWFDQSLRSIQNQTLQPDEVLIVTDGPITLELDSVIAKYERVFHSLKVVRLENNVGFGNACQVCIENSSNQLVARMDSDDIAANNRFEKQIEQFMKNPDLDMVGGAIGIFEKDLNNIVSYSYKPSSQKDILKLLKRRSPFAHVTMMYKKNRVIEAGGYIEWFCEEDYYLWARMLKIGCNCMNLSDPLVYVRTTPEQMGRRGGKKYFCSEVKMQKYLLQSKTINVFEYCFNVILRFIAEILMPPTLRYQIRKLFVWKNNGRYSRE